jgi:Amt family ammonium transporter
MSVVATYTQAQVDAKLAELSAGIAENAARSAQITTDADQGWIVICGAMVFFMQIGFGMLEAGAISKKNVQNILYKNFLDASGAAICYWLLGYGFAYGDTVGGFIGNGNFGIDQIYNGAGGPGGADGWTGWFFQWAFTGAAATIVAGSVAERCKIEAYFVYSVFISTFIYPIVVHWVWGSGFLSAWGAVPDADGNARPIFSYTDQSNGVIDFAGSGVVHMVGGVSGMMGAIALGPRKGRFDEITGAANAMPGHNQALAALGTGILWFGWYGFNCGSTLVLVDAGNLAGKVAVNTTIAAAAAIISGTAVIKMITGNYDLSIAMNCILAGLVGITAPCSVVNPWHSLLIGITSSWVYIAGHYLFLALKIDDPLDAAPLHGLTGAWGLLCVGIFCTDENVQYAAYPNVNDACARGEQFGVQVVGMIIIFIWCVGTAGLVFFGIKATIGLRVPADQEEIGMDLSEHGGDGFADVDDLKARALASAYAAQPAVATREVAAPAPAPVTMAPITTMPITGSPPMMVGAAYPPQQMYSYPVTTTTY